MKSTEIRNTFIPFDLKISIDLDVWCAEIINPIIPSLFINL